VRRMRYAVRDMQSCAGSTSIMRSCVLFVFVLCRAPCLVCSRLTPGETEAKTTTAPSTASASGQSRGHGYTHASGRTAPLTRTHTPTHHRLEPDFAVFRPKFDSDENFMYLNATGRGFAPKGMGWGGADTHRCGKGRRGGCPRGGEGGRGPHCECHS
jgi:hypothetical protein